MKILFNPIYRLKPDDGRVLIMHARGLQTIDNQHDEDFSGFIHPLHAVILSFVNGDEYSLILQRIKNFINLDIDLVKSFIDKLIDCDHRIGFQYGDAILSFPSKTIISSNLKREVAYNNPEIFLLDKLDLRQKRHKTVSYLTIMLNNKCVTNCYYCYADKRKPTNCLISYERLCEIIHEASELGVVSIDLIGGEVFLYPKWKELLIELRKYHFHPLLSTKMPLTESDVKFLCESGHHTIQVSLDSLIPETLNVMLRVSHDYIKKIKHMFFMLQKYGVKVAVHTVLTSKNSTIDDMKSLFDFLCEFDNVLYWKPDVASESIYAKPECKGTIEPKLKDLEKVVLFFKSIEFKCLFPLIYTGLVPNFDDDNKNLSFDNKMNAFLNGGICAGNYSQLFILPDGKVTICEELYWHPRFILGDINLQSLQEIWNSEVALSLYHIKQDDFSDSSACKTCNLFERCRGLKQVCYRDIVRRYGVEHWDYPDEKCPKAPYKYT